ncbi:MAG: single-stranded DNA-binding protein [Prochloraceae cyanobacterium]|nr:single-stranded DNA-binding protein [Prochloraceae cyanobacterium]
MNSCILMARIISNPELRYTQDNQVPLVQMLVEFEELQADAPPATLKVIGWRNLATEIKDKYFEGDRVIIQGRLEMNTIVREDERMEKRAQLVASRIYALDGERDFTTSSAPVATPATIEPAPMQSYESTTTEPQPIDLGFEVSQKNNETVQSPISNAPSPTEEGDLDEIPF